MSAHNPPPTALPPRLDALPEWQRFVQAARQASPQPDRLDLIETHGLTLDSSGQRHSDALIAAGQALLQARGFEQARARLLRGEVVNLTEERAAWHSLLRAPSLPEGTGLVRPDAQAPFDERERVDGFVRRADAERRWRHIVHIGIGGSDWGVRLAVSAFGYAGTWRDVRFVANIDGHAIEGGLAGLDPRHTLVVLASKSFATAETLENGARAREWLQAAGQDPAAHMVAVTARPDRARAWGVPEAHIFRLWDWIGGRFSIWSAVSLTTALAVGSEVLAGLRMGAAAMDEHFAQAPPAHNAPVRMALAGVVNRSVLGHGSLNIAPYDSRLANLVPYVQQLDMESLGKSVDIHGRPVGVATGPAVWGMPGTDAQHTFFQWLHQGSDGAPVDFIFCRSADHQWPGHHRQLVANCLAQREALMRGKTLAQALDECRAQGLTHAEAARLAPHRVHPGGRPNHLIVLPRLTPYSLGALLALYEHRVFTQAVIWGIDAFDQWGVEYGKGLADSILAEIDPQRAAAAAAPAPAASTVGAGHVPARAAAAVPEHDRSTCHWIQALRFNFPFNEEQA
ncbi:glucose-6-phosphate isomerase [Castellaniella sp.]|uniref:glucose-6-phosphate isomerase n=1 Tax=Castellaniella sp. TaxID=1955812 RepID=UPI00355F3B99